MNIHQLWVTSLHQATRSAPPQMWLAVTRGASIDHLHIRLCKKFALCGSGGYVVGEHPPEDATYHFFLTFINHENIHDS